jgi:N-acetylglucosamine malate deacetylase 1
MPHTILAIGAHYDDCPFGLPGTLLKAVRQHHRVVVLNLIGDYSNWPPVKDRAQALLDHSVKMAAERGIEMRFLKHASMGFEPTLAIKREVAQVVAEVAPDTAFMLWKADRHPDHEAASAIAHAALFQPARLLGKDNARSPSQVFWFDNGPGHTIDFTPDTYFDVSDEWTAAMEWLGELMAFVKNAPFDPTKDAAIATKTVLAQYRGLGSGVKYAEAVRSVRPRTSELFP